MTTSHVTCTVVVLQTSQCSNAPLSHSFPSACGLYTKSFLFLFLIILPNSTDEGDCLAGNPGPPGFNGQVGFTGATGSSGFPGPSGFPGATGFTGFTGPFGSPGNQGNRGAPGSPGIQGWFFGVFVLHFNIISSTTSYGFKLYFVFLKTVFRCDNVKIVFCH